MCHRIGLDTTFSTDLVPFLLPPAFRAYVLSIQTDCRITLAFQSLVRGDFFALITLLEYALPLNPYSPFPKNGVGMRRRRALLSFTLLYDCIRMDGTADGHRWRFQFLLSET